MNITNIKINRIHDEVRLKAVVSVTFDDMLAVHDIKVIEGPERTFLAMPSRKMADGTYRDIVHPITADVRQMLEKAILTRYAEEVELARVPVSE
jgi:stage V sporulation protein G